jgi:ribonucleoside-diphosphate reductase alpha chain
LGTWQACLTDFRYLRSSWKRNCEDERLLGVSITGIMDCELLRHPDYTPDILEALKAVAVETNKEWADRLGIPQSAAVTCVKPSGTVSQLVDASSGIHPRHSPYYIRRVRQDVKDPLTGFMIERGFPCEPDVANPDHVVVFSFPMRAPEGAVCRDDWTAVEQLRHWKTVQDHWCEHKPSITVTVRENEWPGVGSWVWENFDSMSGVSFLPHSNHSYRQAPYEEVTEEYVATFEDGMPKDVNWDDLEDWENEDNTTGTRELACTANKCDI